MRTKCLGEKRPPSCSSLSSLSHWSRPSASPNTVQWLNASCEHRPCREQANLSVLVDVYMKVLWETLRLLYSLYMTVCERERMCVWVNFIGAQTFLLALKNKKKKNSLHKCQIFLGLLTACKFLWTQNVVFLGQKKKLCVSLWAVLNEFVDERERERDHYRETELCLSSSDGADMWDLAEQERERSTLTEQKRASCFRNPCGKHPKAGKLVVFKEKADI